MSANVPPSRLWLTAVTALHALLVVPYATGAIAWGFHHGFVPVRPVVFMLTVGLLNLILTLPRSPVFARTTLAVLALISVRVADAAIERFPAGDGWLNQVFGLGQTFFITLVCAVVIGVCTRVSRVPMLVTAALSLGTGAVMNVCEWLGMVKMSTVPGRAAGFLGDANDSAYAIVLMLTVWFTLSRRFWLDMLMLIAASAGVFPTFSRSGMLCLLLVALGYGVLHFRTHSRQLLLAGGMAALAAGIGFTVFATARPGGGVKDDNVERRMSAIFAGDTDKMQSSERVKDLADGWEAAMAQPVTGYGTGAGWSRWQPHNQIVSTWLELGLMGAGFYVAILGVVAWKSLRARFHAVLPVIPVLVLLPFSQTLLDRNAYWYALILSATLTSRQPISFRLRKSTRPSLLLSMPGPPDIVHILYSGAGGVASAGMELAKAGSAGVRHSAAFYGIEPMAEVNQRRADAIGLRWNYFQKRPGLSLAAQREMTEWIAAQNPVAVIAHSPAVLYACRLVRRKVRGVRIIAVEHHCNALKSRSRWVLSALAFWLADRVVYLTDRYRDEVRDKLGPLFRAAKSAVIPNGLAVTKYPIARGDRDVFVAGMQGRMVEGKDFPLLLHAMVLANRLQGPRIRLEFAGDGPRRAEIEALADAWNVRDDVEFCGLLSHDELLHRMSRWNACAHATAGETMSLAIMEAQACGLPLVASDAPGVGGFVRHEANGLLVAPGDPAAMAAALRRLANDPALSSRLGTAARADAQSLYDPARVWALWRELLFPSPAGVTAAPPSIPSPLCPVEP